MGKASTFKALSLFFFQIILCVYGTEIFTMRANPFALLIISALLTYTCYQLLVEVKTENQPSGTVPRSLIFAAVALAGFAVSIPALRKIWEMYPDAGKISDVLPQLKGQADLYFSGQFPYQRITTVGHLPFPVYMPLHWAPFQLSNMTGMDWRWPGIIMIAVSAGISAYFLSRKYSGASMMYTLPATLLFALPLWAFIKWSKLDLGVSSEGIVAAYYILLATGLAVKNTPLIILGLIGAILSRYTLIFWLPLFAILLWLYEPIKKSLLIWSIVGVAGLVLFAVPFLLKDPTIFSSMSAHYDGCSERSWLRPDEWTFKEGLSLNIHLREWMPGNPEDSLKYKHLPQIGVQLVCILFGVFFYRRRASKYMDIYTYSLLALSIMPMLFYNFSPMLFQYYMLMPLAVSTVLCWKVIAERNNSFSVSNQTD